jgi:integrase
MKRLNVGSSFVGWDKIERLADNAYDGFTELLLLTIFLTGGRTSEVLGLKKDNFSLRASKYSIVVRDMRVLKKFDRIVKETLPNGKKLYEGTKRKNVVREFPILRDEPLNKRFEELLLKKPKNKLLFPISRQLSLYYVKKIGASARMKINDHWLRGQRVAQLKSEYGFKGAPLNEWIGWSAREKGLEMQTHYGKLGWQGLELELLDGKLRRQEVYRMIENR